MRNTTFLIILFLAVTSCLEIEPEPQDTFRKVVGGLGQSLGRKLVKMDDGSILLLGSETIVAKREVQLPNGTAQTEFIRQIVPSLVKLDQNGNVIDGTKRLYPMYSDTTQYVGINQDNQPEKGRIEIYDAGELIEIKKINGGYFVVGKWTETSITFQPYVEDFDIDDWNYFMILDEEFRVVSLRSMNAEFFEDNHITIGNFDIPLLHRFSDLYQLDDGSIRLITFTYPLDQVSLPATYSTWNISNTGDVESINYAFPDPGLAENRGYKIVENGNGNLSILTRRGTSQNDAIPAGLGIDELDPNTSTKIGNSSPIDLTIEDKYDPQFSRNTGTDQMLFLIPQHMLWNEQTNEYAVFYFSRFGHYIMILDENGVEKSYNRITSQALDFTDVIISSDGGYVTLSEPNNRDTGISETIISKLDSQGNVIWQRQFSGYPRSVIETEDGGYLFVSNPFFNDIEKKTTVTKIDKNGKL